MYNDINRYVFKSFFIKMQLLFNIMMAIFSIMWKKVLKFAIEFVGIFFLVFALYLVWREIHTLGLKQVANKITELPLFILLIALFFIICDYTAFSGYDFLALRYIGAKLKKWIVIKTAFISFSVTNTTGHAYMAGGSIRYFFYSKVGLNEFQVLKMIAFESLTFLMGMGLVLDVCLILSHFLHLNHIHKYQHLLDAGAVAITIMFLTYLWFVVRPKRCFKWHNITIKAPTLRLTAKQMLVGSFDIISASLVFYTLFRAHMDASYLQVAIIFLIAQVIGIASQVPGGLGVFEAGFLYLFPHTDAEKLPLLAVLITFRALYYFLPLAASVLWLLIDSGIKFISSNNHHQTTNNPQ